MKKLLLTFVAIMAVAIMGNAKSTKLDINGKFSGISVSGNIEVTYTPSTKVSAKVNAPEGVEVKASVVDNVLTLSSTGTAQGDIKVTITGPALDAISTTGNAEVKVETPMNTTALAISATGDSEVKFVGVIASNVAVRASGNSEVKFDELMCENLALDCSGNAEADFGTLTGNVMAINGSGNAEIDIKRITLDRLAVNCSGNAQLEVAGQTNVITFNASDMAHIDASALAANGGSASASGSAFIKCHVAGLNAVTSETATIHNV